MSEPINSGQNVPNSKQMMQEALQLHAGRLLSYITRKLPASFRGHIEPDDVLQDVFFQAFRHADDFNGDGEDNSYSWLAAIARHRILELIRSQRTLKRGRGRLKEADDNVALLLEELSVYRRTPSQSAMSHEVAAALHKTMALIEPSQREVLSLRYLEGLSPKQSAARMGRTERAILMLCVRGLRALRERLPAGVLLR